MMGTVTNYLPLDANACMLVANNYFEPFRDLSSNFKVAMYFLGSLFTVEHVKM